VEVYASLGSIVVAVDWTARGGRPLS